MNTIFCRRINRFVECITICGLYHHLMISFTSNMIPIQGMLHNCGIRKVVNVWTQGASYNSDSSQEASINQRQYSNNDGDIFALNVLGITVLQFVITFGGTNLFILVQQISEWIKGHVVILWISCAIYLVLQTVWMFVPALSRKYPYNVMYLVLMTLFSTIAIASDATLYFEDFVYFIFAVSVTFINLIVCTITVLQYDFSKHYTINLFVTLSIGLILIIGQILYFTMKKNNIVLVIAGAITFPLTVFKLLFEMKMVFGGGTFRYHQMDLVLAAGILYNCWWNLFLTLMWLSSMTGLRNLNSTNTTTTSTILLNVQSSTDLVVLTKLD